MSSSVSGMRLSTLMVGGGGMSVVYTWGEVDANQCNKSSSVAPGGSVLVIRTELFERNLINALNESFPEPRNFVSRGFFKYCWSIPPIASALLTLTKKITTNANTSYTYIEYGKFLKVHSPILLKCYLPILTGAV